MLEAEGVGALNSGEFKGEEKDREGSYARERALSKGFGGGRRMVSS